MRHRTSGLLAWASLAIIIGVPTTEVLLSKQNKNTNVVVDDSVIVSKKVINVVEPIIKTPQIAEIETDVEVQEKIIEPLKNNIRRDLEEENLPRSTALLDRSVIFPDLPATLPYSPIPIEFRLAGNLPSKSVDEYKPKQNIVVSQVPLPKAKPILHTRVVGDAGMTIGSRLKQIKDTKARAPQNNEVKQDIKTAENGIDEEFLKSQALKQETQTIIDKPLVAVVPPVAQTKNGLVVSKYNSIIRIGRGNVDRNKTARKLNIIRVPARQNLRPVNFYDLIATQQVSAHIITIRPSNRQRLDRVNNNAVTKVGYASQAQVLENDRPSNKFVTYGSFISQLPSTRGSSVRLDLLN